MKAPETIETARLLLRKPTCQDAEAIFSRYAADPIVTRYMSWPTHRSVADTQAFLAWCDTEWQCMPAGSYLVFERGRGDRLLGGTGLAFKTPTYAATGYVFAQDAWGQGYATESLQAMVALAPQIGVQRLEAICHTRHYASAHVMEKCGFVREGVLRAHIEFPNIYPGIRSDVLRYVRVF
jgi:RimJ/RimL family protein N-acetyltransferase